jgi:hypothetical protein
VITGWWQYSNATNPPPSTGQLRTAPDPVVIGEEITVYLHCTDDDGLDWADVDVSAGKTLVIRDSSGNTWNIDLTSIENTVPGSDGYGTAVGILDSATATAPRKNERVQVNLVREAAAGPQGPPGPPGDPGMNWVEGTYDPGLTYNKNDVVYSPAGTLDGWPDQGRSVIAIQNVPLDTWPDNTDYWETVAIDGAKGSDGAQGPQGVKGDAGTQGAQGAAGPAGAPSYLRFTSNPNPGVPSAGGICPDNPNLATTSSLRVSKTSLDGVTTRLLLSLADAGGSVVITEEADPTHVWTWAVDAINDGGAYWKVYGNINIAWDTAVLPTGPITLFPVARPSYLGPTGDTGDLLARGSGTEFRLVDGQQSRHAIQKANTPGSAQLLSTANTWTAIKFPTINSRLPFSDWTLNADGSITIAKAGIYLVTYSLNTGVLPSAGTNDVDIGLGPGDAVGAVVAPNRWGGSRLPALPASSSAILNFTTVIQAVDGDQICPVARCSRAVSSGGFQIMYYAITRVTLV